MCDTLQANRRDAAGGNRSADVDVSRDSELSRFNRAPAGEWFAVSRGNGGGRRGGAGDQPKDGRGARRDGRTAGAVVALRAERRTGGNRSQFEPPSDAVLRGRDEPRRLSKSLDVRLTPPALRKRIDGLEVDLSSIAPGYAIDQMAALLAETRHQRLHGGDRRRGSRAGRREDGKPWRVAIERPLVERREMQIALPLADAAIATAGDYRKFFEHDGRRYSHIIDPATGRPVEHTLASVTVVADTCMEADGWDTPLLVMGPERGFECAEQNEIAALFIVRGETGDSVRVTPKWRERFKDHTDW